MFLGQVSSSLLPLCTVDNFRTWKLEQTPHGKLAPGRGSGYFKDWSYVRKTDYMFVFIIAQWRERNTVIFVGLVRGWMRHFFLTCGFHLIFSLYLNPVCSLAFLVVSDASCICSCHLGIVHLASVFVLAFGWTTERLARPWAQWISVLDLDGLLSRIFFACWEAVNMPNFERLPLICYSILLNL